MNPPGSARRLMWTIAVGSALCIASAAVQILAGAYETSAGGALDAARVWAGKVAALPPLPVRMTKEAVDALDKANHHAATFMDRDQYLLTSRSADFREGAAAFFEKRPPKFSGN